MSEKLDWWLGRTPAQLERRKRLDWWMGKTPEQLARRERFRFRKPKPVRARRKPSNLIAAILAVIFGPLGLVYKGRLAAAVFWVVAWVALIVFVGGVAVYFLPLFWIGMVLHAYAA